MNIFVTDKDPVVAAQNQCDKLLIKMILEQAQLLCTAHRMLAGQEYSDVISGHRKTAWILHDIVADSVLYRATHHNHPCSMWIRASDDNYKWGYQHFVAMCDEYTHRYNKVHKSDTRLRQILADFPNAITLGPLVKFVKCMGASPESLAIEDPIEAYRHFYQTKQTRFKMIWTNREKPEWFKTQ